MVIVCVVCVVVVCVRVFVVRNPRAERTLAVELLVVLRCGGIRQSVGPILLVPAVPADVSFAGAFSAGIVGTPIESVLAFATPGAFRLH